MSLRLAFSMRRAALPSAWLSQAAVQPALRPARHTAGRLFSRNLIGGGCLLGAGLTLRPWQRGCLKAEEVRCEEVAKEAPLQLVHIETVPKRSKVLSAFAWGLVMLGWSSLVWLPALILGLAAKACTVGLSAGLKALLTCAVGSYALPSFLPCKSLDPNGTVVGLLLSWFDSVEIWADKRALERPKTQPTMLFYHPHGVFCVGMSALFHAGEKLFPDGVVCLSAPYVKSCAPILQLLSRFLFPVPVRMESVSRQSIHKVLKSQEHTVFMIPGGIQEATLSQRGHERVYLKRRKGFIKYALQHGYACTPVYCFGENDTYENLQVGMKWRLKLNEGLFGTPQGIPTVMPFGWCFLPLLPRPNSKLRIAVGAPLQLPRIPNPSREDVEHWHAEYSKAVQELYDATVTAREQRAHQLGYTLSRKRPLEIV
eukprot:TRINITY_DN114895_c0_g1_i1.p1 TRINITY_DN114895_c0_g1~~TRINITY_DN114895_c0_g1_i1.p1  ORF type:complete len:426 (-),score=63.68 TRINITY_DN114895_c0_g1_i1:186-1463(-)